VEGLNGKAKLTMKKACGFKSFNMVSTCVLVDFSGDKLG
jgi:hypothetical protein